MPVRLHINVDHVATVRNARGTPYPDPVYAAQLCETAGADGITVHLREDRRHIRDDDVERMTQTISTPLNLEMAATKEMIGIAQRFHPAVITLVPERREERTTEGGLDVKHHRAAIAQAIAMARDNGIRTSLFIAPEPAVIELARELGADQIELHTGEYSAHRSKAQLKRLADAAAAAAQLGLEVAAGHGLTRHNVGPVSALEDIVELNIGHAVISDAIMVGLVQSVRDFRSAIDRGVRRRRAAKR